MGYVGRGRGSEGCGEWGVGVGRVAEGIMGWNDLVC